MAQVPVHYMVNIKKSGITLTFLSAAVLKM